MTETVEPVDAYERLQNQENEFDLSKVRWHKFASAETLVGECCTNCQKEFEEGNMIKLVKLESGDDSWLCKECADDAGLTIEHETQNR